MKSSEAYIAIKSQHTVFQMDILDHVLEMPCSQSFLMRKFKISSDQASLIMQLRERCRSKESNHQPHTEDKKKDSGSSDE